MWEEVLMGSAPDPALSFLMEIGEAEVSTTHTSLQAFLLLGRLISIEFHSNQPATISAPSYLATFKKLLRPISSSRVECGTEGNYC